MQRAWGEDHTGTAPDRMLGSRMYTQESKAQADRAERVLGGTEGHFWGSGEVAQEAEAQNC